MSAGVVDNVRLPTASWMVFQKYVARTDRGESRTTMPPSTPRNLSGCKPSLASVSTLPRRKARKSSFNVGLRNEPYAEPVRETERVSCKTTPNVCDKAARLRSASGVAEDAAGLNVAEREIAS